MAVFHKFYLNLEHSVAKTTDKKLSKRIKLFMVDFEYLHESKYSWNLVCIV